MPVLATLPNLAIAVLRLDGDMYDSTVDVLYFMYDKVAMNGFIIRDDFAPHKGST